MVVSTAFPMTAVTAPLGINPFTIARSVALVVPASLLPATYQFSGPTGSFGVSGPRSGWIGGTMDWITQVAPAAPDIAAVSAAMLAELGGFTNPPWTKDELTVQTADGFSPLRWVSDAVGPNDIIEKGSFHNATNNETETTHTQISETPSLPAGDYRITWGTILGQSDSNVEGLCDIEFDGLSIGTKTWDDSVMTDEPTFAGFTKVTLGAAGTPTLKVMISKTGGAPGKKVSIRQTCIRIDQIEPGITGVIAYNDGTSWRRAADQALII